MERVRRIHLSSRLQLALLALMLCIGNGAAQAQKHQGKPRKAPKTQKSVPAPLQYDGVLVAFKPAASLQARSFSVQQQGLVRDTRIKSAHFALLRPGPAAMSAGKNIHTILEDLRRDPNVRVAEPNYIVRMTAPNDTRFGELWGLHNTGQTGGRADADIDALEAWEITTGSPTVKVAVIDSGVDYNHPDLAANIARDAQGRVLGYDYANNDPDPMDDQGHGTHCAGTIGALGNNNRGVIGVSPNVRIIPLKFLTAEGSGSIAAAIQCVDFATNNGAQIMSNSWGGGGYSQLLVEAIQRARQANILFIAAAGNETNNNDQNPSYPASYNAELDNVISVAATDHNDNLSDFSNYGAQSVDIAAPGSGILSTVPGDDYGNKSGTSMATPHVSGAAVLIKARFPTLGYKEIKTRLLGSVDILPSLEGKVSTGGRLNAHRALAAGDTQAPAKPKNLAATHRGGTLLRVQWIAPGDDDLVGTATRYEMRVSTSLITEANFANATLITGVPQPAATGTVQAHLLSGLRADTPYYVALRAADDAGNLSTLAVSGPYRTLATPVIVTPLADNAEGAPKFAGPAPWATTAETAASPTRSYADSPGTAYASNREDALTQTAQLALSGFLPELRFQARTDLEEDYDFLYVEVSTNNGQTWSESLLTLTGTAAWQEHRVSLAHYAGSSIRVRFRIVTDSSVEGEGVWLDDIRITGERVDPIAAPQPAAWRLVWQNTKNGDVSYWRLTQTTVSATGTLARAVPAEWRLIGAPDLNRDGKRDLLWHNTKNGDVSYWLMDDITIKSQAILYRGVPLDWKPAAVADLNEDGKADVVWQNTRNGDVVYWLLNGTTIAANGTLARAVPTVWQITAALDLDGDGSSDLLWRNTQNGDVIYWLLDGTRLSMTGTLARAVPLVWRLGAVADIDGDSDGDLVWQNTQNGDVSYWRLQDTRQATAGMLFRAVPKDWQLRTSF
jgi:subtilisin family serine protease